MYFGIFLNNSIVHSNTEFQDLSLIFLASKYQDFLSTLVKITCLLHPLTQIIVSHSQSQILSLVSTISGLVSIIFLSIN